MTEIKRYAVISHLDHFHVTDHSSAGLLDDRSVNPWKYADKDLAHKVAALLNRGAAPELVKDMEAPEISRRYSVRMRT